MKRRGKKESWEDGECEEEEEEEEDNDDDEKK